MNPFTSGAKPFASGDENCYARRAAKQSFGESCRNVHDMFAIVEDNKYAATRDGSGNFVDRFVLQTEIKPQSSGSGSRHLRPILDRGKFYKGNRVEVRPQA